MSPTPAAFNRAEMRSSRSQTMPALHKVALVIVVSFSIVSGQALLSVFARSMLLPLSVADAVRYSLTSIHFYGIIAFYSVGFISYAYLLRIFPLAEINITLMVVMISMTLTYSHYLGQHLTATQWMGALLAAVGLIALQSR